MAIAVSLAGLQDLLSRRISNLFPALIVLLFVAADLVAGWRVDVWQNLASFALIFVIGSWLFQRGVQGCVDVKSWAAVALWSSEERRVGRESVSTGGSRWSPSH